LTEDRFRHLEETLIRRGLAVRYARRAALEIEGHFRQLVEESSARGASPGEAEAWARAALGADRDLIERFTRQTELRAWSAQWPRLGFMLAPLLSFTALSVAVMVALVCTAKRMAGYLHHVRVPIPVTHGIDAAAHLLFLWIFPICVAGAFAAIAHRQRIALHWPIAGILLLCMVVALVNLQFVITGGPSPGFAGAGFGIRTTTLPFQLLHALSIAAFVLVPAVVARLGWRTNVSSLE